MRDIGSFSADDIIRQFLRKRSSLDFVYTITECYKLANGDRPPKPDVTFAIEPDGKLIYENSGNIGDVTAASANADGSITVRLQFFRPSNDSRTMVVERVGQGIRTILNRNDQNEYSIRNGLFVATGRQVSPLYKCS